MKKNGLLFSKINWIRKFGKTYINLVSKLLMTLFKWFQYRIICRLIGTNQYLKNINIKESPLCGICNQERETIVHLFAKC